MVRRELISASRPFGRGHGELAVLAFLWAEHSVRPRPSLNSRCAHSPGAPSGGEWHENDAPVHGDAAAEWTLAAVPLSDVSQFELQKSEYSAKTEL
jgi:hypothetical protein